MIMNKDEYESLPTTSVAVHMTAGALAGIMEHCVMYPFDSVKVSSAVAPYVRTFSSLRIFYITSSPAALPVMIERDVISIPSRSSRL